MARRRETPPQSGPDLFGERPPRVKTEKAPRFDLIGENKIWTKDKARFIAHYMFLFTQVTKHGTYIDGFAAPQDPKAPDSWAAELVLQNGLLRHFHLCDKKRRAQHLESLKQQNSHKDVQVYSGDFNQRVYEILPKIAEKEACFCLLDQRMSECSWATVQKIAGHKSNRKIELFYFLAEAWFVRSVRATTKNPANLTRWWGNEGWRKAADQSSSDRAIAFARRFKDERGYRYAYAFPIFSERGGGKVMFRMIHATDHRAAPRLTERAYQYAVERLPPPEQSTFLE